MVRSSVGDGGGKEGLERRGVGGEWRTVIGKRKRNAASSGQPAVDAHDGEEAVDAVAAFDCEIGRCVVVGFLEYPRPGRTVKERGGRITGKFGVPVGIV